MKKLSEYEFSDIIINGDEAFFKGVPGAGNNLIPVPDECNIQELKYQISSTFLTKANTRSADGVRHISISLKIEYEGIRFRVADMCDVNNTESWFLRRLPSKMSTLSEIGFPQNYTDWFLDNRQNKGIILVTGNQASGKTTLASTLLTERLKTHGGHAITFEFPAEMPLNGGHGSGLCIQSEINGEVALANSIERAYRYASPNIVYIGEIRTKHAATEVLRLALSSSDQLIIATLHGKNIVSALTRLLTWASEIEGENASQNLADTLLAIIHTELETIEDKKVLRIPEFLFCPFDNEEIHSIRAKIQAGELNHLQEEINAQRNIIKLSQDNKVIF